MLVELGLTPEVRASLRKIAGSYRHLAIVAATGQPKEQMLYEPEADDVAVRWLAGIVAAAEQEDAVLRELGALVVPCGAADVGCKAGVLFLPGPRGATIPLDATSSSHIYRIAVTTREAVPIGTGAMISHYRTCKDPGRFTQRTRKP